MPIFDFECQECKEVTEVMTSVSKEVYIFQCNICNRDTEHKKLIAAHKNYVATSSAYRMGERPGDKRTRK